MKIPKRINRRKFVKSSLMAAAVTTIAPGLESSFTKDFLPEFPKGLGKGLLKRVMGKTGFPATTMGLGGQASLQWTPADVDPVKIILKAFDLGVNYFDTSNVYGPSQLNYGKAFKLKKLVPGLIDYDIVLRNSIFLTSKTQRRDAIGCVKDLHNSLSQMFGDGNGNYPDGAYLDMILIHSLSTITEVDIVYQGLDKTILNSTDNGALAALRDFRDGTNLTALNSANKKLIRHIGFSGHYDPFVNMYMIQRDSTNLLAAMLVSVNANDKMKYNMQYNAIPLAMAKNMGIIAMKVFADGAMYSKAAHWTYSPDEVIRTVENGSLPSSLLIKYTLTTPGVHLAIIGIGQISENTSECQLTSNLEASQVLPDALTESERTAIEELARLSKDGNTNYYQRPAIALSAPKGVTVTQIVENNVRNAFISWNTSLAADAPLKTYEIWRDGIKIAIIPYAPQITLDPLSYVDTLSDNLSHTYYVQVVDAKGRTAKSTTVTLPAAVITEIEDHDNGNESLKISQNKDEIRIELSDLYISWMASLYSMTGSKVLEMAVESNLLIFNSSALPSGIYIIVLSDGQRKVTRKVVKK